MCGRHARITSCGIDLTMQRELGLFQSDGPHKLPFRQSDTRVSAMDMI